MNKGLSYGLFNDLGGIATTNNRIYNFPMPTGQTTSYVTGDDGWWYANYWDNFFSTEKKRGKVVRLDTFTTLVEPNVFGNKNRFTDTMGGQVYGAGNGSLADYVIDNYTGLAIYRLLSTGTWSAAITAAEASTYGGYTDWFIPNRHQLLTIANFELTRPLNYAPFSLGGGGAVVNHIWTSTTNSNLTTAAWELYINDTTASFIGAVSTSNKTPGARSYTSFRKHF